jgi:hypothetical protein
MNPVAHFEKAARAIWASRLGPEQKSQKLAALSDQISQYLSRFDELPEEKRSQDEWAVAAVDRARKYLENLASDVRHLSVQCRIPS